MSLAKLFHIGYHKTASTFIQRGLFEAYAEYFYRVPQREIFHRLIYPSDLAWSLEDGRSFVDEQKRIAGRRLTVFSNERLSGGPHYGAHDALSLLGRIWQVAPDATILVVVREQAAMIRSMYSQFVRAFGMCSLAEYIDSSYTKHSKETFDPVSLQYHRLVEAYIECFGREKVHVVPFELLVRDREAFRHRILDALGVAQEERSRLLWKAPEKTNARSSALQIALLRRLNPLIRPSIPHVGSTYYSPLSSLIARAVVRVAGAGAFGLLNRRLERLQSEAVEQFVADRYAESNARLRELTDLDLTSFGYSVVRD